MSDDAGPWPSTSPSASPSAPPERATGSSGEAISAQAVLAGYDLHKRFVEGRGDTALDVTVLRGVSLTVQRGDTLAVVGPSGAGKSTLLHLLGGLEPPSSGRVELSIEPLESRIAPASVAALDLSSLTGTNSVNGFKIAGETAFDFAGSTVSSAGDVNGDGFDDLLIGAPDSSPTHGQYSGAAYVLFGTTTLFNGEPGM